jgi:hypothetical protein
MSKPVIKRRPHGPINPRFSLMFWSKVLNRVVICEPRRPVKSAWIGDKDTPPPIIEALPGSRYADQFSMAQFERTSA